MISSITVRLPCVCACYDIRVCARGVSIDAIIVVVLQLMFVVDVSFLGFNDKIR